MTPVASTADVTSVSSPHPEDFCQLCGGPNLLCWFVESPLWNKYVREPGHPEILCPRCFAKLAEDAGYNPTAWQLVPENPPAASPSELSKLREQLAETPKARTVVSVGDLDFSQTVPSRVGEEWRRDVVIGWRKEADYTTTGQYWVRWTSPRGLYYWLHPIERRWVSEPEQITMPTWPTRAEAEEAARNAPTPTAQMQA